MRTPILLGSLLLSLGAGCAHGGAASEPSDFSSGGMADAAAQTAGHSLSQERKQRKARADAAKQAEGMGPQGASGTAN